MPNNIKLFFFCICLIFSSFGFGQNTTDSKETVTEKDLVVINDTIQRKPIDPLRPSKAAFYSAVLPGLGQAYNKKYWKIPIVYAAIGTSVYFYIDNNNEYKRYRNAFKSRLAGFNTDEFWGVDADGNPLASPRVSNDGLQRAQEQLRKNKELSLLLAIGFYALNIIDANVDAHLLQYNVDDNLAIRPHYKYNELENTSNLGVTLNFKF